MAGRLFDAIFKNRKSGHVKKVTVGNPAHVKQLAEGNLGFALNLYEAIAQKNEDDNLFFSPFSITVALGMTNVGARKKTSEEVRKTAKFDSFENDDDLNSAINAVLQSFSSESEDVEQPNMLNLVNGLYIEKSYNILKEFVSILEALFMIETHKANFKKDSVKVTNDINEWVAVATKKKITNLISPGVFDKYTRLVLINAIYFKGNWKDKFSSQFTIKKEFLQYPRDVNSTIEFEFMCSQINCAFTHNDQLKCKMLELPYAGDRMGMQIILPDKIDGLTDLMKQLSPAIFQKLRTSLRSTDKVIVNIPKFKLEIGLNLNNILRDLGIRDLFDQIEADLSGISPKSEKDENLYVSDIIHKAFVDVNESGTEAAAATAVVITKCKNKSLIMKPKVYPEFIADHPFFFVIYDKYSDMILFMGRILKPPQQQHLKSSISKYNM